MSANELEQLEYSTRELQRKFNDIISPYREILWRYCMLLTKSPWDAEDLMQETLLKAYASLAQRGSNRSHGIFIGRFAASPSGYRLAH